MYAHVRKMLQILSPLVKEKNIVLWNNMLLMGATEKGVRE